MQTPSELDVWLRSYEQFMNNIKQINLTYFFANISKPTSTLGVIQPITIDHAVDEGELLIG